MQDVICRVSPTSEADTSEYSACQGDQEDTVRPGWEPWLRLFAGSVALCLSTLGESRCVFLVCHIVNLLILNCRPVKSYALAKEEETTLKFLKSSWPVAEMDPNESRLGWDGNWMDLYNTGQEVGGRQDRMHGKGTWPLFASLGEVDCRKYHFLSLSRMVGLFDPDGLSDLNSFWFLFQNSLCLRA